MGGTLAGLFVIIIWVAAIVGWIANIVQLATGWGAIALSGWTIMPILKIVGIFVAPLGSILGWIGILN